MVGEIFLFNNIQTQKDRQKERHSLNEKERSKTQQHTLRPTSNTVKGSRWLSVHCELKIKALTSLTHSSLWYT